MINDNSNDFGVLAFGNFSLFIMNRRKRVRINDIINKNRHNEDNIKYTERVIKKRN